MTDREQQFDTTVPFSAVNMESSGDSDSFPREASTLYLQHVHMYLLKPEQQNFLCIFSRVRPFLNGN